MKLIVGLGNPGKEYEKTRHNVGFMCLDNYLGDVNWKEKFNCLYYELNHKGEKVFFIKPQTYMNLSGTAVRQFLNFFKADTSCMLVIYDDMDLVLGQYKMKIDSGSGGHNGIKSIISELESQIINRLKIGISRDSNIKGADFVLGKFSKEDMDKIKEVLNASKIIIDDFINFDMNFAMNKLGERKNELP